MPSGAKKRKAAKKRSETHSNNNPNPSIAPTQGSGNVKHQDDRQSDVGEASSIASQNPSCHDLLIEGEGGKIENGSDLPPVEGVKSKGDNKHDIVVEVVEASGERDFKIEVEFDRKNGTFEHDETERKSHVGGSSRSSSSSSSDDESHGIKKTQIADNSLHESNIEPVATCVIEHVIKENEEKIITTTYNPKEEEDAGVTKPLLVPPPRPVEKTSWKCCCGLFELFTGCVLKSAPGARFFAEARLETGKTLLQG